MAGKKSHPKDYGGALDGFVAGRIIEFGLFIGRRLPVRASHAIAVFLIKITSLFFPGLRRKIRENIQFVSPVELSGQDLKRMVQENIVATFGLKWMDLFALPRFTKDFVDSNIEVIGLDRYRQAQDEGRGVLLVTWHVGSFPLLCYLALPHWGGTVLAPLRRIFDDRAQENIRTAIRSQGADCAHPGGAVKSILNAFKSGGTVVLAGDHLTSPTGIRVNYLGRETLIPSGPASLACRNRPVTMGCYCVKTGANRYRIEFSDPFSIPAVEKKVEERHLVEMASTYVAYFEEIVKRYPTQWECFFPLWPEGFDAEAIKVFARHYGVVDG